MLSRRTDVVDLVWDLRLERITLGGALVLRQEGEILAAVQGCQRIALHIVCRFDERVAVERIALIVFGSSKYPFDIFYSEDQVNGWPSISHRLQDNFSYFAFARIAELHKLTGIKPRLDWNDAFATAACLKRSNFPGRLYCVHLRSIEPFEPEESNACGMAWSIFFERHAKPGERDFLLLGDDPMPKGLGLMPGVSRAKLDPHCLNLATQLALIATSDGFLGMASGICTAANFSDTPHVIFKHPAHHAAEMERELGTAKSFSFASERQQLWRRVATCDALDEAFEEII